MNHLALFNGIGGFQLAAEWVGWKNVGHVEIDKWCNQKVKLLIPESELIGENIKEVDGKLLRGTIDIISGGDPCQPHSVAGLGKGTGDDRYLWPEMFRLIQEIHPAWVVNENVSGSIANGVLDLKIDDLESEGYTCQAYCLPASAVGAAHIRERVWLVASNTDWGRCYKRSGEIHKSKEEQSSLETKRNEVYKSWESVDLRAEYSYAHTERFKMLYKSSEPDIGEEGLSRHFGFGSNGNGYIPREVAQSAIMGMLDGLPPGLDYTERPKRIKALGNAVVPPLVYEIFYCIDRFHYEC